MLLQLVVHFPEPRVGKDLVALVVNLATHPRVAEVIIHSGLLPQVMLRVLKTRDPLLCKVIRNISAHSDVMEHMWEVMQDESVRMSKWMNEFVYMAHGGIDTPDLLLEVLGTLANMTIPEIPWAELCEVGLVDLLHRLLVPSFSEDDVVLECIMLIGNIALSPEAAHHIAGSRLPSLLQDLLVEKRDDDEVVVQLLFAFRCLLLYDEARDVILQDTEIARAAMQFVQHRTALVAEEAMKTLQVVVNYLPEGGDSAAWQEQLKAYRFENYNHTWCDNIMRGFDGVSSPPPYGDGDPSDNEEEFAFRWAGGDAGDAQDLASRDWRINAMAQDTDIFGHDARFVT